MNGVEILSSEQVATKFELSWPAFWFGFGVVLGILILVGIWNTINVECEWLIIPVCIIFGIIGGVMIGFLFGEIGETPTAYETHYKVTIDDSVSMNEFLDKYEILDQEGKIYTVKERE